MNWLKVEFDKIRGAFTRVKEDMGAIQFDLKEKDREMSRLREDIRELKTIIYLQNKTEVCENRKIIGNTASNKFHYDDCPFGKKIRKDHIVKFDNIEDAVKKGFDECVCIQE